MVVLILAVIGAVLWRLLVTFAVHIKQEGDTARQLPIVQATADKIRAETGYMASKMLVKLKSQGISKEDLERMSTQFSKKGQVQ
jgi:hypothetical protein